MIVLLSCVCDSITQKLCGNRSLSMVREAGTNYDDVRIVFVVCVTISVVVLIGAITFLVWKYQEIKFKKTTEINPSKDNLQDCSLKLAEKLHDFLKSQTMEYGDNGEFKNYKEINTQECKMYNEVLACMIESQQGKKIDVIKLRDALQLTKKTGNDINNNSNENQNS